MSLKELLEKRRLVKKRKPDFIRKDAHKKKALGMKWRKPKGLQSKLRLRKRGHRKIVTPGHKAPGSVRGKDREGRDLILIKSRKASSLENIDPKSQAIILCSGLGKRKRLEIVKDAQKKGINISNVKDAASFIKDVEERIKKRKQEKETKRNKREEKKKKRKAESDKKKEEEKKEKGIENTVSEEERKEQEKEKKEEEKKDKDRVLTQKN